jgi:thiamine-phosphate diphosphorylase
MSLPRLYAITGRAESGPAWWNRFESMLSAGFELIQLRCEQDDLAALEQQALRARDLCHGRGVRLVLNGPVTLVRKLGLDGIHLPSASLMNLEERPVSIRRLVGASCHSSAELAHTQSIGVDFACLSPVLPTTSHPGAPALGWDEFARLARNCEIPVYALGGLGPEDLGSVRAMGGYGVAGISAFWC